MLRLAIAALLLLSVLVACTHAQDLEAPQDLSLMEVGSASSISASAPAPLRDVASLLVEARRNLAGLTRASQPFKVESHHVRIKRTQQARPQHAEAAQAERITPQVSPRREHVAAELVPRLSQPTIHDAQRFGTKHPVRVGTEFVSAEIVGEDGKPFVPRKQWEGISSGDSAGSGPADGVMRSPFAKFVHPPAVGSSADVVNKDGNTALTKVERAGVNSLQLRLKRMLDQLGANIVWDHSTVKNRRLLAEFDALKTEARTLMEEYELRTGVKTIAWQLQEVDSKGLSEPTAKVTDIHFKDMPHLAGRKLQRPGDRRAPPTPSQEELRKMVDAEAAANPSVAQIKPKEQRVNVAWKRGANGVVKARVNFDVVDSKQPTPGVQPNLATRETVPGTKYKSGRTGSPSAAVQIDVVAPANEELKRNKGMAAPAENADEAAKAPIVQVDEAPKING